MKLSIQEIASNVGAKLGPTEWRRIDQAAIDAFAEVTGDAQWIHVDPERAKAGPFGATLAHGYLTLSLCSTFLFELFEVTDADSAINYGLDRVRFPAPVLVDSRVRASAEIQEVVPHPWGVQVKFVFTFEREGVDKPVCIAEVLTRYLKETDGEEGA